MLNKIYLALFVGIFFLPFLMVFLGGGEISFAAADWLEFFRVFLRSLLQATLSAGFSVGLGLFSALGLLRLRKRKGFGLLEVFIWLPNLLPSIIVILSAVHLFDLFAKFPYGITGVVLLHSSLNIGICALAFLKIIQNKMGDQAELALVEGATKMHFLIRAFLPSMTREILSLFIFVFIFCLSSFSIPLIVGGTKATTVEVLIYEQIKINANWSQATLFSLVQVLFVLSFYFLIRKIDNPEEGHKNYRTKLLEIPFAEIIPLFISASLLFGLIVSATRALFVQENFRGFDDILHLILTSFSISFLTGLCVIFLGILMLFTAPNRRIQDVLASLGLPSSVIIAFGLYLFGDNSGVLSILKLVLALALILFIPTYKMFLHQPLIRLEEQIRAGQVFGASHFLIVRKILLPQTWPALCYMGGATALWACGDFAVSSILLEKDFTLALRIKSLLSSYHLELASLLSLPLLLVGGILFLVFWRTAYVFSEKPFVSDQF